MYPTLMGKRFRPLRSIPFEDKRVGKSVGKRVISRPLHFIPFEDKRVGKRVSTRVRLHKWWFCLYFSKRIMAKLGEM